jgi:hypothetical protein
MWTQFVDKMQSYFVLNKLPLCFKGFNMLKKFSESEQFVVWVGLRADLDVQPKKKFALAQNKASDMFPGVPGMYNRCRPRAA